MQVQRVSLPAELPLEDGPIETWPPDHKYPAEPYTLPEGLELEWGLFDIMNDKDVGDIDKRRISCISADRAFVS